ncbi:MAG TPA: choice-of-anchor Q domain-containing protein, partial [Rhodanobacteraceae bacterium]|nr:choice-of-anchor Q domain-containing protein [Rhodanobacteraceae bacterium]
ITECPRLAALKDNGGPTFTHAILPGSPGIDVGDGTGLAVDQRGGGYVRVMGANADIGAFEWQGELDDNLFKSAFEIQCDRYD